MKIVLIGAGNVATHLGIALQKAGCLILQVYSRTEESASALAARLSVDYTIVPDEIRRDADLYIVALKDAVLRQLAPVLVKGREQGIPFEVMLPLIDETAGKVHELSPTQAQTGPAVRYDENVISKHLEMLADEESLQELYEKISKSIHNLPLSVIQANKEGKNS